jgi:hypothetical protein
VFVKEGEFAELPIVKRDTSEAIRWWLISAGALVPEGSEAADGEDRTL